jgi:hypothetical protein
MFKIHPNLSGAITATLTLLVLLVPDIASANIFDLAAKNVNEVFLNMAFSFVTGVGGMLVAFGGFLLNAGINDFVIGFGDQFQDSGIGFAVDSMWVIIRDFMNLFFIFGLVYIGFKMILNSSDSNTRRWLVNLIIAALLINFSLFFTKVVVDISNQLATQIAISAFEPGSDGKIDMSANLMERMGITSVFSNAKKQADKESAVANGGWSYVIGTGIFLLVTAFVFAAGGFLLLIRFAMLNLFLVLSPVMFIGWILPPVSDVMNRYWKAFLGRAFFAPIYLLFVYFSLSILDALRSTLSAGPNLAAATSGSPAAPAAIENSLPYFVIICIFMIASLSIADKLGADGAGKAMSLGKSLSKKAGRATTRAAGGATIGTAAAVGRNTAGRLADRIVSSERGKAMASNSWVGKKAFKAAGSVADSNFDARSVGGVGKTLGIGEGRKGGYQSAYKEKLKKEEAFLESIKVSEDDAKEGGAEPEVKAFKAAELTLENEKAKEEGIVATERVQHDNEIKRLKGLYDRETDKDNKEKLGKDMDQQRGFIKDIKDKSEANVKIFEKAMKKAEKDMNEAVTRSQYKQVDKYLDGQEKWSKGARSGIRKGAILAAGFAGIPGAVGALGMAGEYAKDEAIKNDLRKKIEGEKKKRRKGEKPAAAAAPTPTAP